MNLHVSSKPWWLLYSLLLCIAWLNPNHHLPWTAFGTDWLVAAGSFVLASALLATSRGPWRLHWTACVFLGLSLIPLVQGLVGHIRFAGDAWIAGAYVFAFALAIVVGGQVEQQTGDTWVDALFSALIAVAVVSVGLCFYQWFRLDGLEDWVMPMRSRPGANLAQPNQLATLLGWSLVGVWWFFLTDRLRAGVALFAAAFLLLGIAMTMSRSAWVFLTFFLIVARLYRVPLRAHTSGIALLLLTVWFVAAVAICGYVNQTELTSTPTAFAERLNPGTRLHHWEVIVEAIRQRPLFGWGWNQVIVAQQAVALKFGPVPELLSHSHNLFLDLAVWNGLPIAVGVVVAGAAWLTSISKRVDTAKGVLLLLAVGVFLVHSMLEFPYAYAYLLLPFGMMLGVLNTLHFTGPSLFIPRITVLFMLLLAGVALVWIASDYQKATDNFERLRLEEARIGTGARSQPPTLAFLTQLHQVLVVSRYRIPTDINAESLERMRLTTERFPSDDALLRYAMAQASTGDVKGAEISLAKLCRLHLPASCVKAIGTWRDLAKEKFSWMQPVQMPEQANPIH